VAQGRSSSPSSSLTRLSNQRRLLVCNCKPFAAKSVQRRLRRDTLLSCKSAFCSSTRPLNRRLSCAAQTKRYRPLQAMSAPSASASLPIEYTNLLNELNRTIHRERPQDILQFCANWFNKRLEEQRIELIHHSSYDPRLPPNFLVHKPFILLILQILRSTK